MPHHAFPPNYIYVVLEKRAPNVLLFISYQHIMFIFLVNA